MAMMGFSAKKMVFWQARYRMPEYTVADHGVVYGLPLPLFPAPIPARVLGHWHVGPRVAVECGRWIGGCHRRRCRRIPANSRGS